MTFRRHNRWEPALSFCIALYLIIYTVATKKKNLIIRFRWSLLFLYAQLNKFEKYKNRKYLEKNLFRFQRVTAKNDIHICMTLVRLTRIKVNGPSRLEMNFTTRQCV